MEKNLPAMKKTQIQSLDKEDPQEKGMATHYSILSWRIPWTEDPTESYMTQQLICTHKHT